jgi:phosphotriesterase-related protein
MATVETVQGPVDADELGTVCIHEHVLFRDEAVAANWPTRYDAEHLHTEAINAVNATKEHGVSTIVEPTAMFGGRDVGFLRRVSEATGSHIVACTGIYTYDYLPHYFQNRDADAIADHFVEDIEKGIEGTEYKAGFLKCAADQPGVTDNVEKVHRAVARASLKTGAPIMAHSAPSANTGPRQVEIFLEEGVAPEKIQIAHCGDSNDLGYIEGLLEKGVWVGLDRYGLDMFQPWAERQNTTAALLEKGYANRIFMGADFCATIDWFPEEAVEGLLAGGMIDENWSMTLVFERAIPELREQGVFDDDTFEQVFVTNPRTWLTA